MSIPTRTLDQVERRAQSYFRTSFPGFSIGPQSVLGRIARATARIFWGSQKSVEDVDRDMVPGARNSDEGLTRWMTAVGLSDGTGEIGRRGAVAATGGRATLTGVLGTLYPEGATATSADGTVQIELQQPVTIPGSPPGYGAIQDASFDAVTVGAVSNVAAGMRFTWDSAPPGADSTFKLTSALGGGLDLEDNPTGAARLTTRFQTPPRGGVAEDLREWVEAVGIFGVYVYPIRGGLGTVDVVVTTGGTGLGRVPVANIVAKHRLRSTRSSRRNLARRRRSRPTCPPATGTRSSFA